MLQALFPSWKFFDQVGSLPLLSYRLQDQDWQPALSAPAFRLSHFFLNADGNFHHACQTLVQRLVLELNNSPAAIEDSVSFQLILRLVRHLIHLHHPQLHEASFQFKISMSHPAEADILISAFYDLSWMQEA